MRIFRKPMLNAPAQPVPKVRQIIFRYAREANLRAKFRDTHWLTGLAIFTVDLGFCLA